MSEEEKIKTELIEVSNKIDVAEKKRKEIVRNVSELRAKENELTNKLASLRNKSISNINWAGKKNEWDEKIKNILKTNFKLKEFRHQQLAAINASLAKRDVILLMPTGGGKSLCYQLPSLVTKGITLIISPLLSLIEDQIIGLKKLNINAVTINSVNSKTESKRIYEALSTGKSDIKLIYVTPEWMAKSKRFMSNLQKCYEGKRLDRIAIDEVHCCSQWGHDFRPDYQYLGLLKNVFPDVPLIGLTATATASVICDVQAMLNIQGCVILKASYNRPNLYYEVKTKPTSREDCVNLLVNLINNKYKNQSGIIYTTTINDSVVLAKDLKAKGLSVACYHANMGSSVRQQVHNKWLTNVYQVIVATVAFGMGIDKADVRFVIHHSVPKSVENFYQESGRAGRDGKKAACIVLFSLKDVFRLSPMICATVNGSKNLYKLVEYCLDATRCRRSIIAIYFDEVWKASQCNKMCDHCKNPINSKTIDITTYCKDIYNIINNSAMSDTKLTATKLLDSWFKLNKPSINRTTGEYVLAYLLIKGYLREDFHFTPYNTISYMKAVLSVEALTDKEIKMSIAPSTQSINETNNSNSKRKHTSSNGNKSKRNKKVH